MVAQESGGRGRMTFNDDAIAAHKDALEGLLVNLSSNTAVSGIGFVALLDAYITRLDTNCSDISARVSPPPAQISGELRMDFVRHGNGWVKA